MKCRPYVSVVKHQASVCQSLAIVSKEQVQDYVNHFLHTLNPGSHIQESGYSKIERKRTGSAITDRRTANF